MGCFGHKVAFFPCRILKRAILYRDSPLFYSPDGVSATRPRGSNASDFPHVAIISEIYISFFYYFILQIRKNFFMQRITFISHCCVILIGAKKSISDLIL